MVGNDPQSVFARRVSLNPAGGNGGVMVWVMVGSFWG